MEAPNGAGEARERRVAELVGHRPSPAHCLLAWSHLLLGERRPPASRWLDEPERMEHEAGEKREPEKPEVWEPGLRLRLPLGAGDEEAGEGSAPMLPRWQPEEDVEPLPASSLELESGETGQGVTGTKNHAVVLLVWTKYICDPATVHKAGWKGQLACSLHPERFDLGDREGGGPRSRQVVLPDSRRSVLYSTPQTP